jgi:hypothetical protein
MNTTNTAEEEALDFLFDAFGVHWRGVSKAAITALMFGIAIYVATNSIWKSVGFGFVIFLAASFNTWRRYLQMVALAAFLLAIFSCCFEIPKITFAIGT